MSNYTYNGVVYGIDSCVPYNLQIEEKFDDLHDGHKEDLEDMKAAYEEKILQVKKEYATVPDMTSQNVFEDPNQAYFLDGEVNKEVKVTGRSILVDNLTFNGGPEKRKLDLTGGKEVEIRNTTFVGPFMKKLEYNAALMVNGTDKVVIDGLTYECPAQPNAKKEEKTHNLIEIGLGSGELPSEVVIRNCHFNGELGNNGILVFGMKENGTITLENCTFEKISNPFRYSNKTDVKGVTINIIDCECKEWESVQEYAGFICLQDYTHKDENADPKVFGPEKVTINVKNSFGPGHKDLSTYDTPMNSLCYAYKDAGLNAGIIPFSEEFYPTINFIK